MCNYLIYFSVLVILTLQGLLAIYSQSINPEKFYIKNLFLNEREGCNFENSDLYKKDHAKFNYCTTKTLPSVIVNDFFTEQEYFICVAYFEALYSICKIDKPIQLIQLEDAKNSDKICKLFKDTYGNFNPEYKGEVLKNWSHYVRESMSNETVCKKLCVFGNSVNAKCYVVYDLLNLYYMKPEAAISKAASDFPDHPPNEVLKENLPSININQDKQSDNPDQTNRSPSEVNLQKQSVNALVLNSSGVSAVKVGPALPSVQPAATLEKSPEQATLSEGEHKTEQSISTSNSLQTQQEQEKSSVIQPIANDDLDNRQEMDSGGDGMDPGQEGILPSSDKEQIQSDEDTKLGESKTDDMGPDEPKIGGPLNSNDQDIENTVGRMRGSFRDNFKETEDSNFFVYFLVMTGGCIVAYVLFHNRNKLVALALEGRKGRSGRARGGNRHTSASYSKLHSNLEEAIASNTTTPSAANVLY